MIAPYVVIHVCCLQLFADFINVQAELRDLRRKAVLHAAVMSCHGMAGISIGPPINAIHGFNSVECITGAELLGRHVAAAGGRGLKTLSG